MLPIRTSTERLAQKAYLSQALGIKKVGISQIEVYVKGSEIGEPQSSLGKSCYFRIGLKLA